MKIFSVALISLILGIILGVTFISTLYSHGAKVEKASNFKAADLEAFRKRLIQDEAFRECSEKLIYEKENIK